MQPLFHIKDQELIKIGLAVLCGGLLGLERQYKNKTAGFRTIILICLGSALFTMVAVGAGAGVNINIVTGVGFIGAGVIFKDNIAVSGLTTAAVIWISAAIGMAIGAGNYLLSIVSTFLILIVLISFSMLENYVDKVHRDKLFVIVFTSSNYENMHLLEHIMQSCHLKAKTVQVNKINGCLQAAVWVTGHRKNLYKLDEKLLLMPEVKSF